LLLGPPLQAVVMVMGGSKGSNRPIYADAFMSVLLL